MTRAQSMIYDCMRPALRKGCLMPKKHFIKGALKGVLLNDPGHTVKEVRKILVDTIFECIPTLVERKEGLTVQRAIKVKRPYNNE